MLAALLLLSAFLAGDAFLFSGPAWNDLVGKGGSFGGPWEGADGAVGAVKWGIVGVDANIFQSLPRTASEAQQKGFVPKPGGDACSSSPPLPSPLTARRRRRLDVAGGVSLFRGAQYWNGFDPTIILLFDKNGFIAGIQAGVQCPFRTAAP